MSEATRDGGKPRVSPERTTVTYDDDAGGLPITGTGADGDGLVGTLLVARYQLEARIGAGGMGIVYAALDLQLQRRVAIKLVLPRIERNSGSARLIREAQAMAKVRHANVATLYDIVAVGDRLFVVMELVDGGTLGAWLKQQPRSWREIVGVFLQAAAGLAAAHAAGFVHRDFKPENVLLGSDGVVRVTDFGLARIIGELEGGGPEHRSIRTATQTGSGSVAGTPGYIAPEILRHEAFDERADQFSFCVALYAALFGQLPSDAAGRPPSHRADRVPGWLMRLLRRGLSSQPDHRWPSLALLAATMGRRLRRRGAGSREALIALAAVATVALIVRALQPATPTPCGGAERELVGVWDDARKQRLHAVFAATGKAYAEVAFTSVAATLDRYAAAWLAMHTDACGATHLRGDQSAEVLDLRMECLAQRRAELNAHVSLLASADAAVVLRAPQMAAALSSVSQCADIAGLRAPVRPPADAVSRARVRDVRARLATAKALHAAAKPTEGLAIAVPAADDARRIGYRPLESEAGYQLGLLQRLNGDLTASHDSLEGAIFAARAGRDARMEVLDAAALASLAAATAKFEQGHAWVTRGLAAIEAMGTGDPQSAAILATSAAEVSAVEGNYEAALDLDRRALALREQVEPSDSVILAASHANLGRELNNLNRFPEAEVEIRRGLASFEARLGTDHPKVAWARFLLAYAIGYQGRREESIAAYRSSVAIYEAALGRDSAELALPLTNLGDGLAAVGRYEDSLTCLRRALAITSKTKGSTHPNAGLAIMNIAEVQVLQGDLLAAQQAARRALAIFVATLPAEHHHIAKATIDLGWTYLELHQAARALPLFEQAFARTALKPDERAQLDLLLARARWDTGGDRARAVQHATRARDSFELLGPAYERQRADADAWLSRHRRTANPAGERPASPRRQPAAVRADP